MVAWKYVGQGDFQTSFPGTDAACYISFQGMGGGIGGLYKRISAGVYERLWPPVGPTTLASPKGLPNIGYMELSGILYRTEDWFNWDSLPNVIPGGASRIWCKDGEDAVYAHLGANGDDNTINGSVYKNGTRIFGFHTGTPTMYSSFAEGVLSSGRIFWIYGYPAGIFNGMLAWVDDDSTVSDAQRDDSSVNAIGGLNIWPIYGHDDLCWVLRGAGINRWSVAAGAYTAPATIQGVGVGCIRHSFTNHTTIAHRGDGSILRSTDEGVTWAVVKVADPAIACNGKQSLANDPNDANVWFAVQTGEDTCNVAVSADDGLTWTVEVGPATGGAADQCTGVIVTG